MTPAHGRFEPETLLDPQAQRRLRGVLEKIDSTTYETNVALIRDAWGRTDIHQFKRVAAAAAQARMRWVKAALAVADREATPTAAEAQQLAALRQTYEELSNAYEAMRRMVERGYLLFPGS